MYNVFFQPVFTIITQIWQNIHRCILPVHSFLFTTKSNIIVHALGYFKLLAKIQFINVLHRLWCIVYLFIKFSQYLISELSGRNISNTLIFTCRYVAEQPDTLHFSSSIDLCYLKIELLFGTTESGNLSIYFLKYAFSQFLC